MVADLDGVVTTSASTYDDPRPPKCPVQEGFSHVAAPAMDFAARQEFHEGIAYRTGSALDDMRFKAAMDHEEGDVVIALRPTTANADITATVTDLHHLPASDPLGLNTAFLMPVARGHNPSL